MSFSYQKEHPFDSRKEESAKIRNAFPDCYPIILEKHPKSKLNQSCNRKFLINGNLRVYHLNLLVRKRINLHKAEALYLFVGGKDLLKTDSLISDVFDKHKDEDGFVYVVYSEYTSFGGDSHFENDSLRSLKSQNSLEIEEL